jgi:hypothetical protein
MAPAAVLAEAALYQERVVVHRVLAVDKTAPKIPCDQSPSSRYLMLNSKPAATTLSKSTAQ